MLFASYLSTDQQFVIPAMTTAYLGLVPIFSFGKAKQSGLRRFFRETLAWQRTNGLQSWEKEKAGGEPALGRGVIGASGAPDREGDHTDDDDPGQWGFPVDPEVGDDLPDEASHDGQQEQTADGARTWTGGIFPGVHVFSFSRSVR